MQKPTPRILVYGYGNPGRQDDALGILLSDEIEKWVQLNKFVNIDVDQNYQLNIEDAEKISHYDVVIFADASINEAQSFFLGTVKPDLTTDFTMHAVLPSFIVGLCGQLFEHSPHSFLLQMRGYEWELVEEISPEAKQNLLESVDFLKKMLLEQYIL